MLVGFHNVSLAPNQILRKKITKTYYLVLLVEDRIKGVGDLVLK